MLHMFIAYVKSMLEYACQLWLPNKIKLINSIERVQRSFMFCIKICLTMNVLPVWGFRDWNLGVYILTCYS